MGGQKTRKSLQNAAVAIHCAVFNMRRNRRVQPAVNFMKFAGLDLTIHREGYVFIGIAAVLTCLLTIYVDEDLFYLGALITAWCCYFFRDPARITPTRAGLIISPADGKVVGIQKIDPEAHMGRNADTGLDHGTHTRVSIFLNIFDIHVNRIPADGKVVVRNYRKGKFMHAARDKASADNERMMIVLELTGDHPRAGAKLGVVQIAGLVARRIICTAQVGEAFKAGQRFGIIRFGSRVDLYLPPGVNPLVAVGQYMLGGETVIADCRADEPSRDAVQRE